jgi:hypothetical protein
MAVSQSLQKGFEIFETICHPVDPFLLFSDFRMLPLANAFPCRKVMRKCFRKKCADVCGLCRKVRKRLRTLLQCFAKQELETREIIWLAFSNSCERFINVGPALHM